MIAATFLDPHINDFGFISEMRLQEALLNKAIYIITQCNKVLAGTSMGKWNTGMCVCNVFIVCIVKGTRINNCKQNIFKGVKSCQI